MDRAFTPSRFQLQSPDSFPILSEQTFCAKLMELDYYCPGNIDAKAHSPYHADWSDNDGPHRAGKYVPSSCGSTRAIAGGHHVTAKYDHGGRQCRD